MNNKVMYTLAQIMGKSSSKYIKFKDPEVLKILLANGVGDGSRITKNELAAVTNIDTLFADTEIKEFTELKYFSNVKTLTGKWATPGQAFMRCRELKKIDLKNITTLGVYSFYGCTELEDLGNTCNITIITSGQHFDGCTSLKELILPKYTKTNWMNGLSTMPKYLDYLLIGSNVKIWHNMTMGIDSKHNPKALIIVNKTPLTWDGSNTVNSYSWPWQSIFVPDVAVDAYKSVLSGNAEVAAKVKPLSSWVGEKVWEKHGMIINANQDIEYIG